MRDFLHFILVRGACAALSYAVYLLGLVWFRYEVAYVAAYVFGIAIAYVASAKLVFRERLSRRGALAFPLVYVLQFILGLVLLRWSVELIGIPEWLALGFSIVATLPLTFYLSRWAVRLR